MSMEMRDAPPPELRRPKTSSTDGGWVIGKIHIAAYLVMTACLVTIGVIISIALVRQNCHERTNMEANQDDELIQPVFDIRRIQDIVETLSSIQRSNLKSHHGFLSEKPHLSGFVRNDIDVTDYLYDMLKQHGLDEVKKVPYKILHQHPDVNNPNSVLLLNSVGDVLHQAALTEKPIPGIDTDVGPAYLAYSARGTVEGELIFVNYGTYEDFDRLEQQGVNVSGYICIARFGNGFRGDKVRNCHDRGGIGALLYLDPAEAAPLGPDVVYPKGLTVGGSAMQRGCLSPGGDPETPGYPATPEALRIEGSDDLAKIPAQVVGYDDARVLLQLLGGLELKTTGGFNFTYRSGPFLPEHKGKKVRLTVNSRWERQITHNVIGIIKGGVEPDRLSIVGNHFDAWGFGAMDPSSGTAAILEASRLLGMNLKKGWRPRRSIVIAFWGTEETGISATSREWVEDNYLILNSAAVGYINLDVCAAGPLLSISGAPSLWSMAYSVADVVPDGETSLLETWKRQQGVDTPRIGLPPGGSDDAPFEFFAGIPSLDFSFDLSSNLTGKNSYPAYHTAYETLHMYRTFVDPEYRLMERCAQLCSAAALSLAEANLLPYNMTSLALSVRQAYTELLVAHADKFRAQTISTDWLGDEIEKFVKSSESWHQWLGRQKSLSPATLRLVNDRMMLAQRAFIKPDGISGRPTFRNVVFATSLANSYKTVSFPGVRDQLYFLSRMEPQSSEAIRGWNDVRRTLNDYSLAIRAARIVLDPNLIT